jgi:hypothetical protein
MAYRAQQVCEGKSEASGSLPWFGTTMSAAVCGKWLGSKVVAEIECIHESQQVFLGRLYVANANVAATN